jgi:hypothetical protein
MSEVERFNTTPLIQHEQFAALDPIVVNAMGILQRSHASGDLAVQLSVRGFGGAAYLRSGERLVFSPGLPGPDEVTLFREDYYRWGFSDAEIDSGISVLYDDEHPRQGRHIFVSGLFSPDAPVHTVRLLGEDDAHVDSTLDREEVAAIGRLTFLSQLVGYVSESYPDQPNGESAVNAFIEELVARNPAIDRDFLRTMFWGWNRPGSGQVHNMSPTIVIGMTRFSDIIDEYRSPANDTDMRSHALVQSGQYIRRILGALGRITGDEGVAPLAIEAA